MAVVMLVLALTALVGCQAPSSPSGAPDAVGDTDTQAPVSGGDAPDQGTELDAADYPPLEPFPPFDWDAAMAQLPNPGLGPDCEEFRAFNDAVRDLLKQAYYIDRTQFRAWMFEPTAEGIPRLNKYFYIWGVSLDGRLVDHLSYADTMVKLELEAERGANRYREYAPARSIRVNETIKWDYDAEGALADAQARVLEVESRILHLVCGSYLPLGDAFWCGFDVVHALTLDGVFCGGTFDLPGTHGGSVRLRAGWIRPYPAPGVYGINYSFEVLPPGEETAPAADWDTLVAGLPAPGFEGESFQEFHEATLGALKQVWSKDSRVYVNRVFGNTDPDRRRTGFSWLRLPAPSDPDDFLLESLSIDLLPAGSSGGPVSAQSARVTETVAWGPAGSSDAAPDGLDALVPVRELTLGAYLPLDETFTAQFAALELAPGLVADLVGRDGTSLHLEVEEVAGKAGRWSCRYSLTWYAEENAGG